MNITKLNDGKRKLCEPSYLDWLKVQTSTPTLIEVVEKVNQECGLASTISKKKAPDTALFYSFGVYGVSVSMTVAKEGLDNETIYTKMSKGNSKMSWVHHLQLEDVFTLYIEEYLEGVRKFRKGL